MTDRVPPPRGRPQHTQISSHECRLLTRYSTVCLCGRCCSIIIYQACILELSRSVRPRGRAFLMRRPCLCVRAPPVLQVCRSVGASPQPLMKTSAWACMIKQCYGAHVRASADKSHARRHREALSQTCAGENCAGDGGGNAAALVNK